jgi:hypothetical protein
MSHSFAQIAPDADVPKAQKDATDLSYQRSFEFLARTLAGKAKVTA